MKIDQMTEQVATSILVMKNGLTADLPDAGATDTIRGRALGTMFIINT